MLVWEVEKDRCQGAAWLIDSMCVSCICAEEQEEEEEVNGRRGGGVSPRAGGILQGGSGEETQECGHLRLHHAWPPHYVQ